LSASFGLSSGSLRVFFASVLALLVELSCTEKKQKMFWELIAI
jgi:hypothetical protein